MVELSKQQNRVSRSKRPVGRRSGIIDNNRVDRTANLEINSNIRQARRGGDGGAAELQKIFGSAQNAANKFEEYAKVSFAKRENDYAKAGYMDAETGEVDEEAVQKSQAYNIALSRGKTQTEYFAAERIWREEADQAMEDLDFDTLEERHAFMAEFIHEKKMEFVHNEDGDIRDFGDPSNMAWVAGKLQGFTAEVTPKIRAGVEAKFSEEVLNAGASSIISQYELGQPVDVETAMQEIADANPNLGMGEIKSKVIQTVKNYANELKHDDPARAQQVIDALLGRSSDISQSPEVTADGLPKFLEGLKDKTGAPATSLVQPFAGIATMKPTSVIGDSRDGGSREHNGEDFATPVGTPMVASGSGTVKTWTDKKGGKSIALVMDNGDRIGIAHLSDWKAKNGQRVNAGDVIALSGNTGVGTAAHAHITVTLKDGTKVSAKEYFAKGGAATSATPSSPQFAKAERRRPNPYQRDGINTSLRINPKERADLLAFSEQLTNDTERAADKAEAEKHRAGADAVLKEATGGRMPSTQQLEQWVNDGTISPTFGYSMRNAIEADNEKAENKSDREALIAGNLRIATVAADWNSGGQPKTYKDAEREVARIIRELPPEQQAGAMGTLYSAYRAGEKAHTDDPSFGFYGSEVLRLYGTDASPGARAAAQETYALDVKSGVPPVVAFRNAEKLAPAQSKGSSAASSISDIRGTPLTTASGETRAQLEARRAAQ